MAVDYFIIISTFITSILSIFRYDTDKDEYKPIWAVCSIFCAIACMYYSYSIM